MGRERDEVEGVIDQSDVNLRLSMLRTNWKLQLRAKSTPRESGGEDLLTPPEGIVPVEVGEVSTRLAHLAIEGETSVA